MVTKPPEPNWTWGVIFSEDIIQQDAFQKLCANHRLPLPPSSEGFPCDRHTLEQAARHYLTWRSYDSRPRKESVIARLQGIAKRAKALRDELATDLEPPALPKNKRRGPDYATRGALAEGMKQLGFAHDPDHMLEQIQGFCDAVLMAEKLVKKAKHYKMYGRGRRGTSTALDTFVLDLTSFWENAKGEKAGSGGYTDGEIKGPFVDFAVAVLELVAKAAAKNRALTDGKPLIVGEPRRKISAAVREGLKKQRRRPAPEQE
ncbi:MAG: hypothetical protein FJX42_01290 [Alphaproteobacteria bacterium]|nr:hypothetical protein [Alphaproteobacteria bacterium]